MKIFNTIYNFFYDRFGKPEFIVEDKSLMPKRATTGSCGYDFIMPYDVTLNPNETAIINSGVKVKMPKKLALKIYPRSSIGIKKRITLTNTTGIIDSDFKEYIRIAVVNNARKVKIICKGERVMQGVFVKYYITSDKVSKKRHGGIGSTGV